MAEKSNGTSSVAIVAIVVLIVIVALLAYFFVLKGRHTTTILEKSAPTIEAPSIPSPITPRELK